ncbi:hypothetical protein CSB67_5023 (plasmid) [Enterobacter hormaechei]|nr:hypothetical protein CSB67_5023 [Enterobacter hormaechei]
MVNLYMSLLLNKNDIEIMLLCCESELEKMNEIGQVLHHFILKESLFCQEK